MPGTASLDVDSVQLRERATHERRAGHPQPPPTRSRRPPRLRFVAFEDLSATELRAWELLAERAAEPNPFFEPGFAATAARTLGAAEARLLVVDEEGGDWIGCMPVRALPRRSPRLALGTWKHCYSFLGTPLVDGERVEEFARTLVEAVENRTASHFLFLRDVDEGPVLEALRAAVADSGKVAVAFERSFERAAVERRPDADYTAGLKPSRRKRLRGRRRKLEKAVEGDLRFGEMRCADGAVETFLELEASGWKGEEGTAMACDAKSAEFFAAMCEWFDQRERLRMRVMEGEERTIVMICNLAAGNALFSFKTAFDEDFRKYAPGLLLQLDDFDAWHERNQEDYMDSCGEPEAKTLNELWPDRRTITSLVIGRRGLAARAAGATLQLRYSAAVKRIAATAKRRSTRMGGIAIGLISQQKPLLELCEQSVSAI